MCGCFSHNSPRITLRCTVSICAWQLRAGLGDVLLGDRGARIGVRQHEVRRVATGAYRRDREPALEQPLAVDAVHVVAQDVVLRNVVRQADRRAFAMATAAQPRNLHGGNRRVGAGRAQDVVRAMAVSAGGRQLVAASGRPPVQAGGILRLLVAMASAAIHTGEFLWVRKLLLGQLGVARGALELRMRRGAQSRGINRRRRTFFTFAGARTGVVAAQTFFGPGQGFGLLGQHRSGQHPSRDQAQNACRVPRLKQHGKN